jgi:hypothetical protein
MAAEKSPDMVWLNLLVEISYDLAVSKERKLTRYMYSILCAKSGQLPEAGIIPGGTIENIVLQRSMESIE